MLTITELIVDNLSKRIKSVDILNSISFKAKSGEILAFKGAAGAGKTILLQLIAGMISPTSGKIVLANKNIRPGQKENAFRFGFMSRKQNVYDRLTTRQYLNYFSRLYGIERERIDEVTRLAGILDRQHEVMKDFTENIRARVLIARAILHQPEVLLLDEPTAHLDLETMEILRKLIIKLAEENMIILITTSSQEEAQSLANRTGRLRKGKIVSWMKKDDENQENDNNNQNDPLRIEKIPAKIDKKIILFDPQELIYIEVEEGKSMLYGYGEVYRCPLTLTELEERLQPFGFFRSHRSFIVNLQRVKEVIPWSRNSYSLVLDNKEETTIPLSKNKFNELKDKLGV